MAQAKAKRQKPEQMEKMHFPETRTNNREMWAGVGKRDFVQIQRWPCMTCYQMEFDSIK